MGGISILAGTTNVGVEEGFAMSAFDVEEAVEVDFEGGGTDVEGGGAGAEEGGTDFEGGGAGAEESSGCFFWT